MTSNERIPQTPRFTRLQQYLLRFENNTAATVFDAHKAATYAHGDHDQLQVGDSVKLFTVPENRPIDLSESCNKTL